MSTGFESEGGTDLSKLSVRELRRRFAADTDDTIDNSGVEWSTFRQPSSRGLFGSKIDDRELLFAIQREPAAFRIVHGVARDTLDNWFTIQLAEGKDDGSVNKAVQAELDRLQAKTKLIKLLTLSRGFGYSILLLGFNDSLPALSDPLLDPKAMIMYIEPYSKLEINRIVEVDNAEDDRDGYPKFYFMKKSAGFTSTNIKVHYTRAIFCATQLVDHRYKGWSVLQCLYDDITGFRYMRWGFYMTMIRYGSGFPDVTLKGPEADQAAVDAFIASGQFDNLNSMKYFVHNEQQQLDFKGAAGRELNPGPYYQMALETLSLGSGLPEPTLRGAQAGALTGSEVNERNYFKIISDEQTAFETPLRQLIDKILIYLGYTQQPQNRTQALALQEETEDVTVEPTLRTGTAVTSTSEPDYPNIGDGADQRVVEPVDYKIVWNPNYEPTTVEKMQLEEMKIRIAQSELQFKTLDEVRKDRFNLEPMPPLPLTPEQQMKMELENAQIAQIELLCQTVDEVRKDRFGLAALPDGQGNIVLGLTPKVSQSSSGAPTILHPSTALAQPGSILSASGAGAGGTVEQQQNPPPATDDGVKPKPTKSAADAELPAVPDGVPPEKSISRTLPTLLQDLGKGVMTGKLTRDEAARRGRNIITDYTRLEQEHAILWVKHRANFPGVVIIPPEMQRKLDRQHKRFISDLDAMLIDAEKVYKSKNASPAKGAAEVKPK